MAVKTRKSAAASSKASAAATEHLHPSSAATPSKSSSNAAPSSSSSTASTINGGNQGTHVPLKTRHTNPYQAAYSWTWNPIKIIERKLFRAYWNVEATFVLSMLEAWEVFLVIVVFVVLTLLLWYSLIHYFPRHAQQVATRALYYVYGNSPPPQLAAAVTSETTTNASASAAAAASATDGVLEKLIASSNQLWASLDADKAAQQSNPEVVDRLIANLNKVKQMMGSSGKVEL